MGEILVQEIDKTKGVFHTKYHSVLSLKESLLNLKEILIHRNENIKKGRQISILIEAL